MCGFTPDSLVCTAQKSDYIRVAAKHNPDDEGGKKVWHEINEYHSFFLIRAIKERGKREKKKHKDRYRHGDEKRQII